MNTDDTIRAILRMEADAVDPSAAGWDAITTGIAARRRRMWWVRGGALATAALTVVAVAVFASTNGTPKGLDQANPSPSVSTSASPSPVVSPSDAPAVDNSPIGAIWPLTTTAEVRAWTLDHSIYPSLATEDGAALGFARTYVGIADASVSEVGPGTYDVTRPVNGTQRTVTTVTVEGFALDGGAPYVVTLATSPSVAIDRPAAGDDVTSRLAAHGTYQTVDPAFDVSLRADSGGSAPVVLATGRATTGPPNVWDVSLAFTTTASTGSLLVTNGSLIDSGLADAAAVPVTFGRAAGALPEALVAVRDQRVAVISTAKGTVVRYLTDAQPGGGASDPELSADAKTVVYAQGAGTCASSILSVPVGGGSPTTLADASSGALSHPSRRGDVLAYLRSGCTTGAEIVVTGPRPATLPVDGSVRSGPVVGDGGVAYVTVKDTGTALHADGTITPPPGGCEWLAVTWSGRQLVAAAACGSDTRLYRLDADGQHLALAGYLGALKVTSLDYSTGDAYLLVGAADRAYVFAGGTTHAIPGTAQRPTWS